MKYFLFVIGISGWHNDDTTSYFYTTTIYTTTTREPTTTTQGSTTSLYFDCGGKITSAQTITSPLFPLVYPDQGSSDYDLGYDGFSFEIIPFTKKYFKRQIQAEIKAIIALLPGVLPRFKERFTAKMRRIMSKLKSPKEETLCFEENGFSSKQEMMIKPDFVQIGFLCEKNIKLNEAINSFAANYACDGGGKLFQNVIRRAEKARDFFIRKQNC
ncbi:Oidioi.mRNA.OKI2018_I69.chr2.g4156.t1.cds [Oikopleura dioica]|uniref:Oidioi.mRNA.OKI2018_I69.chr2.g4156.t1.cds n=1 Tax=Oikopleura dioica TaxID=34765 RepID=A0ABN7SY18_OIKDI|nr:Oidioi.mRNA.OKI2018_I69.chr2.g4156.t1.cds [Oikopleura dioica]